MPILTNFLKLLKPEKNDYVDVEKHISENYDKIDNKMEELSSSNDEKLNKGNVSSEYDTAKKIEDKIKAVQDTADNKLNKGNLPTTITDAKEIYDLLENNSGLNFDKNLLFLNDKGVKTQGKIYFDRNKVGMFECIKTTPEDYVANSTTYFVDISNKSSSDRLSNLNDYCSKMINSEYSNHLITKKYSMLIDYLKEAKEQNILHKVMYINIDTIEDLSFLPIREPHEFTILYFGNLGVKALCSFDNYTYLIDSWNDSALSPLKYKRII
ncbi:hypothetical protein [Fusobacterium perfoetens]|uniref:hypothetical protein n=1 Tax=Fusobacterium perfoetens TaxID=852 RepID=UPI001F25BEB6|nr:hypothetical protein [Fusobacterium perfoetens]MCF2612975.1 hypothetical protein [Fusobacterium perfoetens]